MFSKLLKASTDLKTWTVAENDKLSRVFLLMNEHQRKDIYVIAPNGSVTPMGRSKRHLLRFDRAGVEISPGSVIVVPTNYDYQKPLDRYRGITSVVFESVASIAAFLSISKK